MLQYAVSFPNWQECVRKRLLGGLLQHVVTMPAGDRDESDRLGVVSDLLDEVGRLLDDFVEAILRPLNKYCI